MEIVFKRGGDHWRGQQALCVFWISVSHVNMYVIVCRPQLKSKAVPALASSGSNQEVFYSSLFSHTWEEGELMCHTFLTLASKSGITEACLSLPHKTCSLRHRH